MRHNGGPQRADNGGNRRPEEILAEIEQTRHEMDSTLTAIEHRLTPGQLVDQGLDYLRHSGANEFVQNLGGQVKNNPLPVALVGIGVAWLMASSKNPPPHGQASSSAGLAERAGEVKDRMNQSVRAVRERVASVTDGARHQTERARSGMDYMMREQPLALGAVGLAVGALLAAMAPRTRQEDELMGETRDQLMEKAKQAGQETLHKTTESARHGLEQAKKATTKVGVHHSYGDAPTQSVPPALGAAPSAGAAPAPSVKPSGGSRS